MKFENVKQLEKHLENYTLEEISEGYKSFNPEFMDEERYSIPSDYNGWAVQIFEDLQPQIGYGGEKISGHELSDIL